MSETSAYATLFYALSGFLFAIIIGGIILYVLSAIGLFNMAKRENISYAWLAWIPGVQYFLVGDLIGNKVWGFGYANWILAVAPFIIGILGNYSSMFWVSSILGIVFYVYQCFALFGLYKIYKPESATLFLVLGIIFIFLNPIFIFVIRNNERHTLLEDSIN